MTDINVYISTDPERDAREYPTLCQIMTAAIPGVVDPNMRDREQKEIARAVRALLKQLGIRGVSVTSQRGSMCFGVDVQLPDHPDDWSATLHPHPHGPDPGNCWRCGLRYAARDRLGILLRAAFPDLDDRSDYQNDYHDDPLHIT